MRSRCHAQVRSLWRYSDAARRREATHQIAQKHGERGTPCATHGRRNRDADRRRRIFRESAQALVLESAQAALKRQSELEAGLESELASEPACLFKVARQSELALKRQSPQRRG